MLHCMCLSVIHWPRHRWARLRRCRPNEQSVRGAALCSRRPANTHILCILLIVPQFVFVLVSLIVHAHAQCSGYTCQHIVWTALYFLQHF
jgi:hypothetical protein